MLDDLKVTSRRLFKYPPGNKSISHLDKAKSTQKGLIQGDMLLTRKVLETIATLVLDDEHSQTLRNYVP